MVIPADGVRRYVTFAPSEADEELNRYIERPYIQRRRSFGAWVPEYPRFLYRYVAFDPDSGVSVDRLRDPLVRSELWLSAPDDFNDPFDTHGDLFVQGTQDEVWQRLVAMAGLVPHMSAAERKRRRNALLADQARLGTILNESFNRERSAFGVACFTPHSKNLLMWSHYARSHTGLVLQFEPVQDLIHFSRPVPVKYSNEYPMVDWVKDMEGGLRNVMLRKNPVWKYEDEWRILAPENARSYLRFASSALTGVILGCRTTAAAAEAVRALLEERRLNGDPATVLYQATKQPRSYKLQFRRI